METLKAMAEDEGFWIACRRAATRVSTGTSRGHGSWALASIGGVLAWVTDRGRDCAVVEELAPSSDECPSLFDPAGTRDEKGED